MEGKWKVWLQFILGFGLTFLFFYMMAPFIVAILLGAVLAIICYPAFENLKRLIPASLSAICVTMGMALGILLPIFFVIYTGSYKLLAVISKIKMPQEGQALDSWLEHPWLIKVMNFVSRFVPVEEEWLRQQSLEILQGIIEKSSRMIAHSLAGMPGLILGFFIVILSLYFFLLDGERFMKFLSHLSPLKHARAVELFHSFETSCRGVVIGIFVSGVIQGFILAFLFWVTSLPNPALIGVVTLVLGMVPLVGSSPVWIGATVYLFARGSTWLAIVMLVGGIVASLSDNFVRPWIMSGQSKMHPMLALVSVFGAVSLFGATGIFLGPIIAAVFVSFLKIVSLEMRWESINGARATST